MTDLHSLQKTTENGKTAMDTIVRLERRIARLERLLDEGLGAYLNARFPFGKPTDRWARRGRA